MIVFFARPKKAKIIKQLKYKQLNKTRHDWNAFGTLRSKQY